MSVCVYLNTVAGAHITTQAAEAKQIEDGNEISASIQATAFAHLFCHLPHHNTRAEVGATAG